MNPVLAILQTIIANAAAERMTPKAAASAAAETVTKLQANPIVQNALNLEPPLRSGVTYGGAGGILVGAAVVYTQLVSATPDAYTLGLGAAGVASGLYTLYRRWADLPPMFARTTAFFSRWFN